MNPVLVLWLALVHAFSLATATTAALRDVVGRAGAHHEFNTARWVGTTADVPVPDIRVPLRVPLPAARASLSRSVSPLPQGKDGNALPLDRRRYPLPVSFLRQPRHQRTLEAHRPDVRGTLLPYFPTAPPRRA